MNGDNVALLVDEIFRPLNASLDYLFAAGVAYGASHVLRFVWQCARGFRTYLVPYGRYARRDLTKEFGKWAGELVLACSPAHHFLFRVSALRMSVGT